MWACCKVFDLQESENGHSDSLKDKRDAQRMDYLKKQLSRLQREKAVAARELSDLRKRERFTFLKHLSPPGPLAWDGLHVPKGFFSQDVLLHILLAVHRKLWKLATKLWFCSFPLWASHLLGYNEGGGYNYQYAHCQIPHSHFYCIRIYAIAGASTSSLHTSLLYSTSSIACWLCAEKYNKTLHF